MNLMPYDYIPPVDIKTEPYIPETGEADRHRRQEAIRTTPVGETSALVLQCWQQKQEVMSEWTHSEPCGTFRAFCGNLTDVPPTRQSLCSKQTRSQGEELVMPSGLSQCRQRQSVSL